jgi:hypothetical protein
MSLTNFFRINLPYGMKKNSDGRWFVFNREYVPIGWTSKPAGSSYDAPNAFADFPIHCKYKDLTDKELLKIITNPDLVKLIQKNEAGEIVAVWFYNDRTNPQYKGNDFDDYFRMIKELSTFESR